MTGICGETLTTTGSYPIFVDINNQSSLTLLYRAYKELYIKAFPKKEYRDDISTWLDRLNDRFLIIINIDDAAGGEP